MLLITEGIAIQYLYNCVINGAMAFFSLIKSEIQWNQQIRGIWQITEAGIQVNLKILSLTCVLLALW